MNEAVLDSSALLAVLLAEPGAEKVRPTLPGALISAVNLAEVVAKLAERGVSKTDIRTAIESIGVEFVEFDSDQAWVVGELRQSTRALGLSLGDRACLALARARALPAMTADTVWAQVRDFEVILIRGAGS